MLVSQPLPAEVTCAPFISDGQARIRRASLVRGQSIREVVEIAKGFYNCSGGDMEYKVIQCD